MVAQGVGLPPLLQQALALTDQWGLSAGGHHVAAAVVDRGGLREFRGLPISTGDTDRAFRLASISKLFVAYAALIAVEEGSITLDEPAGPPDSTVRHLLAHAAGYAFDGDEPVTGVGRKRIYSNTGIERFAEHLTRRTGIAFADYLREAVLSPLGLASTELRGSPAYGIRSTVGDLARFAAELLEPTLISAESMQAAVTIQFPGLTGIVPGVGRFDPCDWGLGFELNAAKAGHWTGTRISPLSFGHFGGSGTFLIIDPTRELGVVCLTDRDYGPWALAAWPTFIDSLLDALDSTARSPQGDPQ